MRKIIFVVTSLLAIGGCGPKIKPVEITESGWVISCSDKSDLKSSGHGLPFMLFQTVIGGHFDTFTFSTNSVPPCETWRVRDVHTLDITEPRERDYEITVIQHLDWRDEPDGTWNLVKMRALESQ